MNNKASGAPTSSQSPPWQHAHILVVDDDRPFCNLMARSLELRGFTAAVAHDGRTALEMVRVQVFDLVLLDLLLPEMDGLSTCRELRSFTDIPVIMVTALNRTEDVIHSIAAGADSVIVKPFRFQEAIARVMAVLRRVAIGSKLVSIEEAPSDIDEAAQVKRYGNPVVVNGRTILLSELEYRMYCALIARANRPISKAELLRQLWGDENPANMNLVERTISRLRAKVEPDPANPQLIVTKVGGYYVFVAREPPL